MMLSKEREELSLIQDQLLSISKMRTTNISFENNRKYFDTLRDAFRLFEDIVSRLNKSGNELEGDDRECLFGIIGNAIMELGGVAEPSRFSLKDYDHLLFGPFLGVSDEGGAVHAIRRAAIRAPKIRALGTVSPIQVGVAHDAERLAAVGEVAVGPEEYRDIILGSQGSILTSTNVGTRLNLRYYKMRPILGIPAGSFDDAIKNATQKLGELFLPFLNTPDGRPRPVTVLARFPIRTQFKRRVRILKALTEALAGGRLCNQRCHKLGLLVDVSWGHRGLSAAKASIDLAREVGIAEVAIQGQIRWEAENKISMPGLLNYFRSEHVSELLEYSQKMGVSLSAKNLVDPDTVARNIWGSLQAARNMGLHLGKYGLFPLTFEECDKVMGLIQRWFSDWSAAPAFYLDFPHMSQRRAYTEKEIDQAAKRWIDMVAGHSIPLVLLDTADKDKGRKLLKNSHRDRVGILTLEQLTDIDHYANERGIRCLWAGGITLPQAFELGKLKLFGIYVTTSAAEIRPVSEQYASDPMLTAERKPTFQGVYRAKLLLEAGFLITRFQELSLSDDAEALNEEATRLIRIIDKAASDEQISPIVEQLAGLAQTAWKKHFKSQIA